MWNDRLNFVLNKNDSTDFSISCTSELSNENSSCVGLSGSTEAIEAQNKACQA